MQNNFIKENDFIFLLKVVSCAINNQALGEIPDNVNVENVVKLAQAHSIGPLCYYALKNCEMVKQGGCEGIKKLKLMKNTAIAQITMQDYEIDRILAEFEQNEIKNMPLKGYNIRKLYPEIDMRLLGDVDILVNKKDEEKIDEILTKLGLKRVNANIGVVSYEKSLLYLEMHTSLTEENDEAFGYFSEVWQRALRKDDYRYSYKMTLADEYVYMIQHLKKHFYSGGVGIKMLLDIYIYNEKHKDKLKTEEICNALKMLGLVKFEEKMVKLSYKWFSKNSEIAKLDEVGRFIMQSHTYGRLNYSVAAFGLKNKKNQEDISKTKYLFRRIFPEREFLSAKYKILRKSMFFYVPVWFVYWFNRVFIEKNLYKSNLKIHFQYGNNTETKEIIQVLEMVGLK